MAAMDGTVHHAILDKVIRRVVEVPQPDKIILFGWATWGQMGPYVDGSPASHFIPGLSPAEMIRSPLAAIM